MLRFVRSQGRRWLVGVTLALYLRFLLIPTAWAFYELYHLIGIELVYWGYGRFKVARYYFGIWPY